MINTPRLSRHFILTSDTILKYQLKYPSDICTLLMIHTFKTYFVVCRLFKKAATSKISQRIIVGNISIISFFDWVLVLEMTVIGFNLFPVRLFFCIFKLIGHINIGSLRLSTASLSAVKSENEH